MLQIKNDKHGVNSIAEGSKWVSVVTSFVGIMIIPALHHSKKVKRGHCIFQTAAYD